MQDLMEFIMSNKMEETNMKRSLLVLLGAMVLTGCSSQSSTMETTAPIPTEAETTLVPKDSLLQTQEEEETELEEETTAVMQDPVSDKNGNYTVERWDFKEYYKNIKNSKYSEYDGAIIVDQVIPNSTNSDSGEQIPSWDFNYAEYNYSGLSSIYEKVPEIARSYAMDGVNTCLSVYMKGQNADFPNSVTYAAIDNNPGKGWEQSIIFSIENSKDIKGVHLLLTIFVNEHDRAIRVALFDARNYNKSDLSEYNSYKGPTMTLNPDTNEAFDVIGTMPLGEASYINRIKE